MFDQTGRVLLIQRKDNRLWAMPGGVLEVGETPAQGTKREVWEETGIKVDVIALSGVYDSRLLGTRSASQLYQLVFICTPCDANAEPSTSTETLDARWYAQDRLPDLSPGHDKPLTDACRRWNGTLHEAVF